jgi:hypothetical protein
MHTINVNITSRIIAIPSNVPEFLLERYKILEVETLITSFSVNEEENLAFQLLHHLIAHYQTPDSTVLRRRNRTGT